MTGTASAALGLIAEELRELPNQVVIEGHTDAVRYGARANYTNWELSADRANAARRVLERGGIEGDRIAAVRGLADRQLRNADRPLDPANRRISILLPYTDGVLETVDQGEELPPELRGGASGD